MNEIAATEKRAVPWPALVAWVRRRARNLAPFATLVLLVVFFSATTDSFLNLVNLRNILAQVATLAVVATGVTFVLLCGEIDLSIASVAMMTGVIASMLFGAAGLPDPVALLVALLAATLLGALNGVTTTRVGRPPSSPHWPRCRSRRDLPKISLGAILSTPYRRC